MINHWIWEPRGPMGPPTNGGERSNSPICKLRRVTRWTLIWDDLSSIILDMDLFETRQWLHWDFNHNGFVSKWDTPTSKSGELQCLCQGTWMLNRELWSKNGRGQHHKRQNDVERSLRSSGAAGCCSPFGSKKNTIPPASGFPVDLLRKKGSSNSWIIQMVYSRLLVGLVQSESQIFLVTGLEVASLGMTPPCSQDPWRPNWLCTETLREQRPGWHPAWSSTHHRTKEVQTYSLTWTYPLVNVYKKLWKDPPFCMGKLTISMAMFNSKLLNYQRVHGLRISIPFRIPHFWTMNQRGNETKNSSDSACFFLIFTIWNNIMSVSYYLYNVHITIYIYL
jgi:hypothetical protein